MPFSDVLLKGNFPMQKSVISIPTTVRVHDSAYRKQVISGMELQKSACERCSAREWGGSRQDAIKNGSSGKSKVKKETRIECQIILGFPSNKDKMPSPLHQPLKELDAKPSWDMGLGMGSDPLHFENMKLYSVASIWQVLQNNKMPSVT